MTLDSERLAIVNSHADTFTYAFSLSRQLNAPLFHSEEVSESLHKYDYLLIISAKKIFLQKQNNHRPEKLFIDFTNIAMQTRLRTTSKQDPLAKSIGLHRHLTTPSVLDATAGLGRDGITLAFLGCNVHMIERSFLLAILLQDALKRAALYPDFKSWLPQRVHLTHQDSMTYLQTTKELKPDVIYLDPMFPERKKSAKVKQEMQFLQELLREDTDIETLLTTSLENANHRVVIKRPRNSPCLMNKKPNHAIYSPSIRYDIYLTNL